jgi:hypothetical protein
VNVPSRSRRTTATVACLAGALLAGLLTGCGSGGSPGSTAGSSPGVPSLAPGSSGVRPSSPAVIRVVQPAGGASLTGTSVHVVLRLDGAQIVSATTTNIRPDQGHIHLYVDNVLVSMNYGLEQDVPVQPGTYVVKAEFVAADHAPFSPRVWSPEVFFTVR